MAVFVWIMLDAAASRAASTLLASLALIAGMTVIALTIYAMKSRIFEYDGRLAKNEVLFAIICFQIVMQFSFAFSIYAVNQTELQNESFDGAYAYFVKLQQAAPGNSLTDYQTLDLETGMPEYIESVIATGDGNKGDPNRYFRFPVQGGMLLMRKSQQYFTDSLLDFAITLLMSLVVSVLLMAEIVLLAIKLIDRNSGAENCCEDSGDEKNRYDSQLVKKPAGYLRQMAFIFYFAGFLGVSFIPVMARDFAGDSTGADFIAGLPYSVEAFGNCAAILLTARLVRKKGWKPPYLMGAAIFIAGLFSSAVSPGIHAFIISRLAVGMGYGLCWMTLRSIAATGENRAESFAGLTSGIYAGIMCGVAFGAVLADTFGYRAVLLISAAMSLIAVSLPLILRNSIVETETPGGSKVTVTARDIAALAVFLAAIVIPTCITDAFCTYLTPLYINSLNLPTAYVGRVSLIYNLALVYISSILLLKIVWRLIKNPLLRNAAHMVIISAALFTAAYLGGFIAIVAAGALLGCADGFGFSVQNAYLLDMRVAMRIGVTRTLTLFSLFKKFCAMLAPMVLGLFIMNGFQGLGLMGAGFIILAITAPLAIILLNRKEKQI